MEMIKVGVIFGFLLQSKNDSKLLICFKGGKHDPETCNEFLNELFERLQLPKPDNRIKFFTDGNYNYIDPIAKTYCEPCMEYGQIIKQKVSIQRSEVAKS